MGGQLNQEAWAGFLSDVRLWDHALTQQEIQDAMAGSAAEPGDFDENGALDVVDVNLLLADITANTNTAKFDLNNDQAVNPDDLTIWVRDLKKTWFGDADLNGEFTSGDLVSVFTVGKYETGQPATWDQGDWTGNGVFDSGDFVTAFTDGGYELGPRAAVASVPEPASVLLLVAGLFAFGRRRRAGRAA
jgi:hypothetical protein